MGFRNNFNEADSGNGIKPEGWYECLIVKVEERQTKNGAWGLNFSLVIRNDVGQRYGNGYIFHTIWKKREPNANDAAVKGYNFGQLMALARAAKLPDGKDYETLAQFCEELVKKPLRVKLIHEEWNGNTQERVGDLAETAYPECRHVFKTAAPKADSYAPPAAQTFAGSANDLPIQDFADDDGVPF